MSSSLERASPAPNYDAFQQAFLKESVLLKTDHSTIEREVRPGEDDQGALSLKEKLVGHLKEISENNEQLLQAVSSHLESEEDSPVLTEIQKLGNTLEKDVTYLQGMLEFDIPLDEEAERLQGSKRDIARIMDDITRVTGKLMTAGKDVAAAEEERIKSIRKWTKSDGL